MSGSPRAVFDTNVLISSLLTNNTPPQHALDIIIEQGTLLFSLASLTELAEVLAREKFDRYLSREKRARFLATLSKVAEIITVTERFTDCRDPDDNKFLDSP